MRESGFHSQRVSAEANWSPATRGTEQLGVTVGVLLKDTLNNHIGHIAGQAWNNTWDNLTIYSTSQWLFPVMGSVDPNHARKMNSHDILYFNKK